MAITTGGESGYGKQTVINPYTGRPYTSKELHMSTLPASAPVATGPAYTSPGTSWDPSGITSGSDGGYDAAAAAAAEAAAAEARAKQAARDKSAAENSATNAIVDALIAAQGGYAKGRDTMLGNAKSVFETALSGILKQYQAVVKDTGEFSTRNEQDYDSKEVSALTNFVRESNDALSQVLSLGAGETDALRALMQAVRSADANRLDNAGGYQDTLRSINSQLQSGATSAENARLNSWNSQEEARAQIWNDFNKNMLDNWTNVQRSEAANTNVESDYSVGFSNRYGTDDAVNALNKIAEYAGASYKVEKPKDDWAGTWDGKRGEFENASNRSNRAAGLSLGPAQRAEGATLRRF